MITTRTPLRITLGGGGSDLKMGEGICIAATIDKYVTITVADEWTGAYVLHYSESERAEERHQIKHRILRAVFERLQVGPCQVSSIADVPGGTGLGNSGAFTVGLIHALHPEWSRPHLAEVACELDLGQQDQWAAVYGGMNVYDFAMGTVRPVHAGLSDFHLVYTGLRHDAADVLTGPPKPSGLAHAQVRTMVAALERDDLEEVGYQFDTQWAAKLQAQPTPAHDQIDRLLRQGCDQGAYGGKLVGAGDGGFLLFAGDPGDLGLRRLPFTFTSEGSRCM